MRTRRAVALSLVLTTGGGRALADDAKVADAVRTVDAVVARGPFAASWSSLEKFKTPAVVPGRQVRHLHPLGRLLRARLRQRVVPAQHVPARTPRSSSTTVATYGPQSSVRLQGLHPAVQGREVRRRPAGRSCSRPAGAQLRRPRRRAPRRLPDVRLRASPTGPRPRWARSATSSASWPRPSAPRASSSALSTHRAEHWWFFDQRHDARLRRAATPASPASTARPRPEAAESGASRPTRQFLDDWLARTVRAGRQVPAAGRLVRLVDRPARVPPATSRSSPPTTTTAAPSGAAAWRSTTRSTAASFPDTDRRVRHRARPARPTSGPPSGRPTRRSRRTRGATSPNRSTRPPTIVDDLVDIVSKNGALLLNIGPRRRRHDPRARAEILLRDRRAGWRVNGEAIYGTRPWRDLRRRPDPGRRRVVRRHEAQPVHRPRTSASPPATARSTPSLLAWPESGRVRISSLRTKSPHLRGGIESLELVGGTSSSGRVTARASRSSCPRLARPTTPSRCASAHAERSTARTSS